MKYNIHVSLIKKKAGMAKSSAKMERVMGLEPTISCLGSKRSTTELHPQ